MVQHTNFLDQATESKGIMKSAVAKKSQFGERVWMCEGLLKYREKFGDHRNLCTT